MVYQVTMCTGVLGLMGCMNGSGTSSDNIYGFHWENVTHLLAHAIKISVCYPGLGMS